MSDHPKTLSLGGDLEINRLGFGSMQLTGDGVWGEPADREQALRVLRRAAELGVDHIDTADAYGPDIVEELIHTALHPYGGITVASKSGLLRPGPAHALPPACGRPDYLRQQLHKILRRLEVDQLDLWYLHRIDPTVPAADQFAVLAEARDQGLVRHVGLSDVSVSELEAAREVVPIAAVQQLFNLTQQADTEVLDYCEAHGIAYVTFFPLGATGELESAGTLERIAAEHEATVTQVALAWLLQRSPVICAIPGTKSLAHLEENVAAADLVLSDADMEALAR